MYNDLIPYFLFLSFLYHLTTSVPLNQKSDYSFSSKNLYFTKYHYCY